MARSTPTQQREELARQRRKVDFDTYDITVDELVRRVSTGKIEIAPAYQRQFRWDAARQSRLIESIFLGIPVPPLFMATNVNADAGQRWEVVDGLQRLLSLTNFLGDFDARESVGLVGPPLRLRGLEILQSFDGCEVRDLPVDITDGLLDRPVKVIVLNDKSDVQVRFDLFERLNTGGLKLTDQEIREAVYGGPFMDLLSELANTWEFQTVVKLQAGKQKDGTPQDFVLRFFAFHDRYYEFDHSVKDFLNDFTADMADVTDLTSKRSTFVETFAFLARTFPNGIHRGQRSITPVNLYEAVSVGAAFALEMNPQLPVPTDVGWLDDETFRTLVTGATNDKKRVRGRIEYARDRFLVG